MNEKQRNLSINNWPVFQGVTKRVKLIARLMADRRVNPLLKLLPIGSLVYLVVPTDLMPLLPFDDAAVIWLGTAMFVELCPPEIVREHERAIEAAMLDDTAAQANPSRPNEVIDAEFRDVGPGSGN